MQLAQLARPHTLVTRLSAASHATAFLLWEFPGFLPGADQPGVHISRPDAVTIARRRGVVGHRGQFFPDEIVELYGAFVTSRVRTWLDIARRMSVDELTVVADHLLRHPRPEFEGRSAPHATLEGLADMLDRHKGTPGIRKARLALEQARVGADSAPETRLRLALARRGFPDADVNVPVALGGGIVRQPDLAYPAFRVAVEYDGEGHSSGTGAEGHQPRRGFRGRWLDPGTHRQDPHGARRAGGRPQGPAGAPRARLVGREYPGAGDVDGSTCKCM
ncbi:hypothetical protein R5O87_06165 [Arthrobacter globiformis]|uniref:hypothetical protein n=1 Tax=Arthrobacter globiformis TaxID=1665 RepID=UPI003978F425